MNTLPYLIAIAFIGVCGFWILKWAHIRRVPLDELFEQFEAVLPQKLYPFVELRKTPVDHTGILLWRVMGGFAGLKHIHRQSGILFSVGLAYRRHGPTAARQACNEIIWSSLYLRVLVWFCMIETLAIWIIPFLPRIQVRGVAALYCDIATEIEVMIDLGLHKGSEFA